MNAAKLNCDALDTPAHRIRRGRACGGGRGCSQTRIFAEMGSVIARESWGTEGLETVAKAVDTNFDRPQASNIFSRF